MRKLAPLAALLAIAGVVPATFAAEANGPVKRPKLSQVRLKSFGSCAALVRFGRRQSRRGPGAVPPLPGPPTRPAPLAPPLLPSEGLPPGAVPAPAPEQRAAEDDSSGTNVQERGVDEPDLVKTAGALLFAVAGGQLRAIDVAGDPRLLDSLELPGWGHELLLHESRLLVISHDQAAGTEPEPGRAGRDGFAPYDPGVTMLTEVDVSDPAALRVVRTERVRGVHVSSRLTGHTARVVVWTRPRATYQPALRDELRGWLPRRALRKGGRGRPRLRRAAPCRRVLRPATFSGVDVLTVLTIDLAKGLPAVDSDAIMSGGQVVYGSADSLYVATQKWTPSPGPSAGGEPPRTITTVHRFGTADPDSTHYRASGQVPGFLLNQFSLSEHRGLLRVASTEEPEWWDGPGGRDSESFVSVLDERDGALVQIGRVGGLGKGERIYAVRFIGDAGYVVTFRQVDPLYVVDLERPTAPVVRGELKIRGYSAYLHPLEPGLLLGVGQDASEEEGIPLGTQLSLFDVSDPSRPRRLHQQVVAQSSSDAELDHHAFLFWAPRKLAVLPLTVYGREPFQGALGFGVRRAEGIAQVGRAEHPEAAIVRSFVAGGRLFTLSDTGLELNDFDTLAERAWLPFP